MNSTCTCQGDADRPGCSALVCQRTELGKILNATLDRISPIHLFDHCVSSQANYDRIEGLLRQRPSASEVALSWPVTKSSTVFDRLPPNVAEMVLLNLTMRDRLSFSTTSRANKARTTRALLTSVIRGLRPYNLSLFDLQFLQSCTSTIVTGMVLARILYEENTITLSDHDIQPPTLDLFFGTDEALTVATFLSHATRRSIEEYGGDITEIEGVDDAYTLTREGAPNINVFEAWSEKPIDAILRLPTTADYSAWTLKQIWIPYPSTTLRGCTMTTPDRLPLDSPQKTERARNIIHRLSVPTHMLSKSSLSSHLEEQPRQRLRVDRTAPTLAVASRRGQRPRRGMVVGHIIAVQQ
ncbi:hypothetical protein C8R43DRAFT_949264 [Mycena crocata]|nr:hypothetical protein C8R43DRAFT_949264 [Mycena crocata]